MFIGNGLAMNWYYMKITQLDIARFWCEIGRISLPIAVLTVAGFMANPLCQPVSKLLFAAGIGVYTLLYVVVTYKFAMNEEEKGKVLKVLFR